MHTQNSRRCRACIVGVLLLAVSLVAASSAAAETKERVGSRINLFDGRYQTFPAGQPFHIAHGWGLHPDDTDYEAVGKFGFSLEVDGVNARRDYVEKVHEDSLVFGALQWRFWVHNFPDGLSGTHTFTGRWYGPCQGLVDGGYNPGPCDRPTTTFTAVGPVTTTVAFFPTNQGPNLALGKQVSASNELATNPAELAIDGNFWTYWNSGAFPPQWIEIDLGEPTSVGEVALSITQLPDSQTVHRLYGKTDPAHDYVLLREFAGVHDRCGDAALPPRCAAGAPLCQGRDDQQRLLGGLARARRIPVGGRGVTPPLPNLLPPLTAHG